MKLQNLELHIGARGEFLLNCKGCSDTKCGAKGGFPARGLLIEHSNNSEKGIVTVGMDLGGRHKKEKDLFDTNFTYDDWKKVWTDINPSHYRKVRILLRSLGYNTIIWTDIVKGHVIDSKKISPVTIERCISLHLRPELELVPDWPIVALGKEVFKLLVLFFPHRIIIGIPHPSFRASTHWKKIAKKSGYSRKKFKSIFKTALRERGPSLIETSQNSLKLLKL